MRYFLLNNIFLGVFLLYSSEIAFKYNYAHVLHGVEVWEKQKQNLNLAESGLFFLAIIRNDPELATRTLGGQTSFELEATRVRPRLG